MCFIGTRKGWIIDRQRPYRQIINGYVQKHDRISSSTEQDQQHFKNRQNKTQVQCNPLAAQHPSKHRAAKLWPWRRLIRIPAPPWGQIRWTKVRIQAQRVRKTIFWQWGFPRRRVQGRALWRQRKMDKVRRKLLRGWF